jgi:putative photosynthetic complex assembly protein 2
MLPYLAAIGFTIALWWSSTVAILYLDRCRSKTFIWSMIGATALLLLALWGISETLNDQSITSAYIGFTCGIVIWGWQLSSFYLGFVTGPRRRPCEPDLQGWPRFREGVKTSLYHELVVIAFGAVLILVSWDQPNKSALWTYLVLYWMHQSAKLNLFFGALNHGEALLPPHLGYLASFMKRKPMNLLFPISVSLSTVVTVLLVQMALADAATPFEAALFTMLACLMALAVLEHWFLVLPLPVDALWQWGASANGRDNETVRSNESNPAGAPAVTSLSSESRYSGHEFESDFDHPTPPLYAHLRAAVGLQHQPLQSATTKRAS